MIVLSFNEKACGIINSVILLSFSRKQSESDKIADRVFS